MAVPPSKSARACAATVRCSAGSTCAVKTLGDTVHTAQEASVDITVLRVSSGRPFWLFCILGPISSLTLHPFLRIKVNPALNVQCDIIVNDASPNVRDQGC